MPGRLLLEQSSEDAKVYWICSLAGTVGLFPLLFTLRDEITELLLTLTYTVISAVWLNLKFNWKDQIIISIVVLSAIGYFLLPVMLP